MSLSNSNSIGKNESLKELKGENSSSNNTLAASAIHNTLGNTDLNAKTDLELQHDTQDNGKIYPGGLKLFLIALVSYCFVV